ncbi:DOPA-like domain-containing protein [Fimicolochytrium jonesii]|uniref:DOPA-like domain-containing protein n=1 Tax=Fimicolochytrium jonesii TaxID=1396493 RepID=UPI0022FEAAAE|nr:DOPA-like domain-containing protein [Fimicolochytrium jonesii]KAI8825607.1 DOPA-like domain-containing protein [Fimicolochytrium jonesii]
MRCTCGTCCFPFLTICKRPSAAITPSTSKLTPRLLTTHDDAPHTPAVQATAKMAASELLPTPRHPAADDDEIKEFHFHTYFFQRNPHSLAAAQHIHAEIQRLNASHRFTARVYRTFNTAPVGPHTIGSFETWVPRESFHAVYDWFLRNRHGLSILVHPLTRFEVRDHTEAAVWMGAAVPLDLAGLTEELEEVPRQYPELGLGYSAKK